MLLTHSDYSDETGLACTWETRDVLRTSDVGASYLRFPLGFAGFSGFAVRSSMVSSFAMVALLAIRTEMTSSPLGKLQNTLVAGKETGAFPLRCAP